MSEFGQILYTRTMTNQLIKFTFAHRLDHLDVDYKNKNWYWPISNFTKSVCILCSI